MNIILAAFLFSTSLFASELTVGAKLVVQRELKVVAGERNQLHGSPSMPFTCDLLMKGSDTVEELTLHPQEVYEVTRAKTWSSVWDEQTTLSHGDFEISSADIRSQGLRLMISCDSSTKIHERVELSKDALSEKLKETFSFE